MHRFFVEQEQISEKQITIMGQDAHHINHVLRMRIGEEVLVSDGENMEYVCSIQEFVEEDVVLKIHYSQLSQMELPSKIYLFQCLPKGDKMELIIQKAVELGAYEIIPVASSRCVVKLDAKKEASKIKRWQGISESAAKQSKRMIVPEIRSVMKFSDALKYAQEMDVKLIPYENAKGMEGTREIISRIKPGQSIAFFIGPEGGLDESEVEAAQDMGVLPITLGKRILRTETAGLTVLSILMYHLES